MATILISTPKSRGTQHRASPLLRKVGDMSPIVHPRIYAHDYQLRSKGQSTYYTTLDRGMGFTICYTRNMEGRRVQAIVLDYITQSQSDQLHNSNKRMLGVWTVTACTF